jgi:PhnB protein
MAEQTGTGTNATSAVPIGYHTVNPYLTVHDVPGFIRFVTAAFDAVVLEEIHQPGGRIAHAEVRIGDSLIMVGSPEVDAPLPRHAETRTGTFYVYVADVDATYRRAMTCGASSWEAPTERFYGDRVAAVVDDNDNVWWIATHRRKLTPQQLQERADQYWRSGESAV